MNIENVETCKDEFDNYPLEVQKKAKQIVKSLYGNSFTIHDAKTVLRCCEILLEFNVDLN